MTGRMEDLLGLGPFDRIRVLPGSRAVEGREFRYISDPGQADFSVLFKRVVRCLSPPAPKAGGVILEGCTISLPTGEKFQALSYKGDIDGWRVQLRHGVSSLHLQLAEIVGEAIVIENGQTVPLSLCAIEFD